MESNFTFDLDGGNYTRHLEDSIFLKAFDFSHLSSFWNDSSIDDDLSSFPKVSLVPSDWNETLDISQSRRTFLTNSFNITNYLDTEIEPLDSNLDNLIDSLNLYISGYAILITASIGLIINVIGICRLSHTEGYKKILNILRILNFIFDSIYLGFQINRALHTQFLSFSYVTTGTYYIISNSGERFSYICSVLTLVALGHSQYNAITNPFEGRRIALFWSVRRKQLLKYLIPTTLLATCFTIPIIFEIDTEIVNSPEGPKTYVVPSKLRINPFYSMFLICSLNLVLLGLLPFTSLLYFAYYIRDSFNSRLNTLTSTSEVDAQLEKHQSKAVKMKTCFAVVLTLMLIIFLIEGFNIVLFALFFLFCLLYFVIHTKTYLEQKIISLTSEPNIDSLTIEGQQRNSCKASKTVLFTICSFIILHALRFTSSFGELIILIGKNTNKISDHELQHNLGIPKWLEIVMHLDNLCLVVYASTNYLIYLLINSQKLSYIISVCKNHLSKFQSIVNPNFNREVPV